jgi:8-oxo-dGTP pyrophosphatase MutT (NUDIX family)
VLFVRRAAHLRRNAGQVAFPGGLADPADRCDLERTALREFSEELGVPPEAAEIVHRLPDALVVNQTVIITPFVGIMRERVTLRVDRSELDAAFEIPLGHIVAPGALHEGIERVGTLRIRTWQLDHGAQHVWGATARILRSFLDAVARDPVLRATLESAGVARAVFCSGTAT